MYENKPLLLIMRHAKSVHTYAFPNDFDRPLNERGKYQPKIIAEQINDLKISLDKALISPSERTRETWTLLENTLTLPPKAIFEKDLYNAFRENFINVIKNHVEGSKHILVIGHCPSVIEVTEFLCGEFHDFKTANLAILSSKDKLFESIHHPKSFFFEKMLSADT
jgi:phosphohistidine phosphatase